MEHGTQRWAVLERAGPKGERAKHVASVHTRAGMVSSSPRFFWGHQGNINTPINHRAKLGT